MKLIIHTIHIHICMYQYKLRSTLYTEMFIFVIIFIMQVATYPYFDFAIGINFTLVFYKSI